MKVKTGKYSPPQAGGPHVVEFESVSELVSCAQAAGVGAERHNASYADRLLSEASFGSRGDWFNGATPSAVRGWLTNPPSKLVAAVEDMRRRIEDDVEAPNRRRRKRRYHQEDGEDLDPQGVLERRLDAWEASHRTPARKTAVRITVNVGVHCGRRPEDLLYRGAAAAVMCDVLTSSGCSVEIVAGFMASGALSAWASGSRDVMLLATVKRMDAPMDISGVSVALAEIGFFRAVMLPALLRTAPNRVGYGIGRPMRLTGLPETGQHDVMFESDILSEESAVSTVRRHAELVRKELESAQ